MAKAKKKRTSKPKATTATIDLLVFVFEDGEVINLEANEGFVNPKTGVLDMDEVMREAATYNDEGAPVDVYRITREVPLPVQSQPEPLGMFIPRDGPLVTPPSKKQRGK